MVSGGKFLRVAALMGLMALSCLSAFAIDDADCFICHNDNTLTKTLPDGRRQIINYAIAGDLLGLQNAVLDKMQHSVEALDDVRLCVFPKEKLWSMFEHHPGLGFDVTWLAAQEKSILADFLVSVGQRSASERTSMAPPMRSSGMLQRSSSCTWA